MNFDLKCSKNRVEVLDPKSTLSKELEFSVSLFENCNLSCKFCFSKNKYKIIDKQSILNVPYICLEYIKNNGIDLSTKEDINISTWGGEIFSDSIPDYLFDTYIEYVKIFTELFLKENPTLDIHFNWLSNGIFKNRNRVLDFLKKVDETYTSLHSEHHEETSTKISFSYDPVDRFPSDKYKDWWYETVLFFKDYVSTISFTMTKPNIEAVLSGDKWFDSVKHLEIDGNYYWPNNNWEKYLPSDDLYFEFFKYCADNRVNCNIVRQTITSKIMPIRSCICDSTIQYMGETCTRNCVSRTSNQNPELFYGDKVDVVDEFTCTDLKKNIYIEKRGCLDCKHFPYCTMGCVGSMCFKHFQVSSKNCFLNRFYKYIEGNTDLLEWAMNSSKVTD